MTLMVSDFITTEIFFYVTKEQIFTYMQFNGFILCRHFYADCIIFFFQSDVEKKIKGVLEPLSLFTTYGDEEGMEN